MATKLSEYDVQAQTWADKWGVTLTAKFTGHRRYFADDKDTRDTYRITLRRGKQAPIRQMEFDYGASLVDSQARSESDGPYWRERARKADRGDYGNWSKSPNRKAEPPSLYDVITCIEKGEVGTFEDWCGDFGYDTDSRKAMDTYLAVQKQAADFARLCGADEAMRTEAQEIQ